MAASAVGAMFSNERNRVAKEFAAPSPLPTYLEKVSRDDGASKGRLRGEQGGADGGVKDSDSLTDEQRRRREKLEALLSNTDAVLEAVPGLRWQRVGSASVGSTEIDDEELAAALANSTEIHHEGLAAALEQKIEFTKDELAQFSLTDLSYNKHIKVGSAFYKPAQTNTRVRSSSVARSADLFWRRKQGIREYQASKDRPPVNKGAAAMENKAAVRSLDDWLGQEGKRVRGKNTRELEKHPTSESYFPRQMETISQYDSEMRANMMVRNSKKLRAVEEQLNEIYGKSRTAGMTNIPTVSKSFAVDEVLGKLSAESLHLIHEKFKAMGGELNVSEFVEVVSSHLPRHEWEDHAGMANNLCEVYERLDVDGDGVVSWEEMFEFTIEMGRSMNTKAAADNVDDVILDYTVANVTDKRGDHPPERTGGVKDGEIERLESLAFMDRVAVLEKDSAIIKLYDAETLDLAECLVGHRGPVMRCQHLEGTDYLILPCRDVFISLAWNAAHQTLYAGSTNGYIQCFRIPDQNSATPSNLIEEIDRFSAHKDVITDLLAVRDLGLLVSASMDSDIKVWDLVGHELKRKLHGHTQGVYILDYIPSQRYLISAGFDYNCKVWNPMIEEPLFTLSGHTNTIAGLRVVPGSNRVVTCDIDAVVKVWDVRTFICSQTITLDKAEPGSVSGMTYVSRLDRIVMTNVPVQARRIHRMCCIDYEHAAAPEVADEGPLVTALVSLTNGTITTAAFKTVRVWNATTGIVKKSFQDLAPANITAMCMDSREQRLIIGDESGQIGVYNCMNGVLLKKLDAHEQDVCSLAYCPFSKCIVSASWGGRIRIHHDIKPDATKILRQIDGHATAVTCMEYSVKLNTVATASSAGSVRLWTFDDVKLSCNLQAHTTEVTLLYWIEDYRILLTGDFLGNLILWTVPPWREKYKPICRWEYIIKMENIKSRAQSAVSTLSAREKLRLKLSAGPSATEIPTQEEQLKQSPEAKRDTPTCCVFQAQSHSLFIGGTSGEIVLYDLKALKGALIEWQGVDESGKPGGTKVPLIEPRVFVRNPREGRTQVPEAKPTDSFMIDSLIRASGDVKFDISQNLQWGKDVATGGTQKPHLESDVIRRVRGWTAHQDSIKSISLIQADPKPLIDGGGDGAEPSTMDTTFLTDPDAAEQPEASVRKARPKQEPVSCALLSASTDQRVCLWDVQGKPLGQLRQGDRGKALQWDFPFTAEMLEQVRQSSLEKNTRQLAVNSERKPGARGPG